MQYILRDGSVLTVGGGFKSSKVKKNCTRRLTPLHATGGTTPVGLGITCNDITGESVVVAAAAVVGGVVVGRAHGVYTLSLIHI